MGFFDEVKDTIEEGVEKTKDAIGIGDEDGDETPDIPEDAEAEEVEVVEEGGSTEDVAEAMEDVADEDGDSFEFIEDTPLEGTEPDKGSGYYDGGGDSGGSDAPWSDHDYGDGGGGGGGGSDVVTETAGIGEGTPDIPEDVEQDIDKRETKDKLEEAEEEQEEAIDEAIEERQKARDIKERAEQGLQSITQFREEAESQREKTEEQLQELKENEQDLKTAKQGSSNLLLTPAASVGDRGEKKLSPEEIEEGFTHQGKEFEVEGEFEQPQVVITRQQAVDFMESQEQDLKQNLNELDRYIGGLSSKEKQTEEAKEEASQFLEESEEQVGSMITNANEIRKNINILEGEAVEEGKTERELEQEGELVGVTEQQLKDLGLPDQTAEITESVIEVTSPLWKPVATTAIGEEITGEEIGGMDIKEELRENPQKVGGKVAAEGAELAGEVEELPLKVTEVQGKLRELAGTDESRGLATDPDKIRKELPKSVRKPAGFLEEVEEQAIVSLTTDMPIVAGGTPAVISSSVQNPKKTVKQAGKGYVTLGTHFATHPAELGGEAVEELALPDPVFLPMAAMGATTQVSSTTQQVTQPETIDVSPYPEINTETQTPVRSSPVSSQGKQHMGTQKQIGEDIIGQRPIFRAQAKMPSGDTKTFLGESFTRAQEVGEGEVSGITRVNLIQTAENAEVLPIGDMPTTEQAVSFDMQSEVTGKEKVVDTERTSVEAQARDIEGQVGFEPMQGKSRIGLKRINLKEGGEIDTGVARTISGTQTGTGQIETEFIKIDEQAAETLQPDTQINWGQDEGGIDVTKESPQLENPEEFVDDMQDIFGDFQEETAAEQVTETQEVATEQVTDVEEEFSIVDESQAIEEVAAEAATEKEAVTNIEAGISNVMVEETQDVETEEDVRIDEDVGVEEELGLGEDVGVIEGEDIRQIQSPDVRQDLMLDPIQSTDFDVVPITEPIPNTPSVPVTDTTTNVRSVFPEMEEDLLMDEGTEEEEIRGGLEEEFKPSLEAIQGGITAEEEPEGLTGFEVRPIIE